MSQNMAYCPVCNHIAMTKNFLYRGMPFVKAECTQCGATGVSASRSGAINSMEIFSRRVNGKYIERRVVRNGE